MKLCQLSTSPVVACNFYPTHFNFTKQRGTNLHATLRAGRRNLHLLLQLNQTTLSHRYPNNGHFLAKSAGKIKILLVNVVFRKLTFCVRLHTTKFIFRPLSTSQSSAMTSLASRNSGPVKIN